MYLRRKVFSCQPSLEDIINEVEERAFSAGYEAAQKEFGNKENKRKRREWEIQQGGGRNAYSTGMKSRSEGAQNLLGIGGSKKGFGHAVDRNILTDHYNKNSYTLSEEAKKLGIDSGLLEETNEIHNTRVNNSPSPAKSLEERLEDYKNKKQKHIVGGQKKNIRKTT